MSFRTLFSSIVGVKKRWLFLVVLLTPLLAISFNSIAPAPKTISAEEAKRSRIVAKRVMDAFFARTESINLSLGEQELIALGAAVHHAFPSLSTDIKFSHDGVWLAASKQFGIAGLDLYLNLKCELNAQQQGYAVERCRAGSLPLPGSFVVWASAKAAHLLFGKETGATVRQILEQARVENKHIIITASKSKNLKQDINNSIKDFVEMARSFNQLDSVDPSIVTLYQQHLDARNRATEPFVNHINRVFSLALQRSQDHDPVKENTAALWALAITFGNQRFARMAGVEPDYSMPKFNAVKLRERLDLRLHFLYSVVLQQVGRSQFGLNIGELKEVLDTNDGGSGYSFADLAADKAGLRFAELATQNAESARYVQRALAAAASEIAFMPQVRDLPEGLSESKFKALFGDVNSDAYKRLEAEIDARIDELPLYSLAHRFIN